MAIGNFTEIAHEGGGRKGVLAAKMTQSGRYKKEPYLRLAEINRAITNSLDFDKVLTLIVENAAQLVDADISLLLLSDAEGGLRIRAALGVDESLVNSFSGRLEEDAINSLSRLLGLSSDSFLISVPVIAKNSLDGLLVIARERPLDFEEERQLSAVADQAAIALRNARLFEMELADANRERDETLEALRTSNSKINLLASIVESSDDAIISTTLEGVITSWNRGAERVFGYTAAEAIGQAIIILLSPDRLNEETAIIARISSGRAVEHYETVRRRKDGSLIDISLTVSPIKAEDGTIIGASKIARDVTAHKKALEEIRFQALLLSAVEQAVIATDLKGNVISWNAFAENLYGWTAEEAVGKPIFELTPTVDSIEKAKSIFETLKAGNSWFGEMTLRRRDKSEFLASVTDSPITNEKGELIGIVGVSVDVTEQKKSEEERTRLLEGERLAREEAEKANRLKDEFLATLSHELRNPLNVVIGYAEILRRSTESRTDSFVIGAAEVIRRNALAQSQLVSDLLDLSRLQMRKLAINRQRVSLSTIISDAIETVKVEAEAKHISLFLNTGEECLIVDGDPVRLGQIAWNLLNNAVKFTPPGGQIRISLFKENGDARLTIEDTGQGISSEFLPHVFEIFRQADASNARKQSGLGIGLALVKQLAELHGGRVEATSDGTGKGSTFSVWIPVQRVTGPIQAPTRKGTTGVLNRKFILVVDDSHETTDMLGKLLQLEGALVQTARSGNEALRLAQKRKFDLVISDISMPEMDGYQLLHKLRDLPLMKNVPVLALTGFGRNTDVDRAKEEGFAAHFTKPLNIDRLLKTVKDLTAR